MRDTDTRRCITTDYEIITYLPHRHGVICIIEGGQTSVAGSRRGLFPLSAGAGDIRRLLLYDEAIWFGLRKCTDEHRRKYNEEFLASSSYFLRCG